MSIAFFWPNGRSRRIAAVASVAFAAVAMLTTAVAAAPVPNRPTELNVEVRHRSDGPNDGSEEGSVEVVLRWASPGPVPQVVGYNVDRNGSYYRTVAGREFVDTEVTVGETYSYRVSAYSGPRDNRGYGPTSESVSITVATPDDDPLPPKPRPPGGPSGDGPEPPTVVRAVPVTGNTESINPDGIRVSWSPGGGQESIGFNVTRNDEFFQSIVGRTAFVDCDVVAGRTYTYRVSAWSEGPLFSSSSETVEATATATPENCRSLTPPGPSGDNEPSTDPLFESVVRDPARRPATPEQVKIVGSGADARLQWEMPPSARMVFQVTRSGRTDDESYELWGQRSVTPGHQDMVFADRGDGGARFSIPVGQFSPGDNFTIQAVHPFSVPDDQLGPDARFSASSRFATIIKPGPGTRIPNFLTALRAGQAPPGPWIGSADDWNPEPQFSDEFNGSGELAQSPGNQWYFARNDGEREITPSYLRDQNQTDDRAILDNGRLVMSAGIDDGAYSYLGTANDQGEGYLIDPTNGVFVEASVRLDRMTPADNAWWAFWLMAPGNSPCEADGGPSAAASNAYDGHAATGTEVDLFEFVPDLANGFNQAIFRYEEGQGANCSSAGPAKLAPGGRSFTYEGPRTWPDVNMPNYMDGDYHRLGLYYAQDCYAVYLDDELLWKVDEATDPGWVTPTVRQSIRLTWEIQNSRSTPDGQINNPWTSRGGHFTTTAIDQDPTVYIDYVNVWEKNESASGLCADAGRLAGP
jgi:hypothetical protein